MGIFVCFPDDYVVANKILALPKLGEPMDLILGSRGIASVWLKVTRVAPDGREVAGRAICKERGDFYFKGSLSTLERVVKSGWISLNADHRFDFMHD